MGMFLDEGFLRKLETLRVLVKKEIKGKNTGIHKSYKTGDSLEFMDYRKYHPGDDFRYVDWNVYGRTERLFIKLFHAEKDLTMHILVDVSRSMSAGDPVKSEYAKKIIAALSYVGLANQDQVGVTSFSETIGKTKSPERGKNVYFSILTYLDSLNIGGETNFNASMESYANVGNRPGIAVIISDLLDPKGYEYGLTAMMHGKFKLVLIQVLGQEEITPLLDGNVTLQDVETGRERNLRANRTMLMLYEKKMKDHLNGIREFCRKRGIGYHLAKTNIPFEDFFLGYLQTERLLS